MASFYFVSFLGARLTVCCVVTIDRQGIYLKMMVERIIDFYNSRGRGCIDYKKDTKCRGAKGVFISLENGNLNNEKKKRGAPFSIEYIYRRMGRKK